MHLNLLVDYLNAEWIVQYIEVLWQILALNNPVLAYSTLYTLHSWGELVSGKKSLHELNLGGLRLGRPLKFTEVVDDDLKLRK